MTLVESKASFKARATDMGLPMPHLVALATQSIDTFAAFAWLVPYNPAVLDEAPLLAALTQIIGTAPSMIQMGKYRRLQFDSYTMVLADTKHRVERTDESVARKMPAPERSARLEAQRARLTSLSLVGPNEPSHALVDLVHQMLEDGIIKYISIDKCTCRSQELVGEKAAIKIANTSSDLLVRQCFLRRSLAFDQAQIISYRTHERWVDLLFDNMQRVPPAGYRATSMDQAMAADREIFVLIGECCNGGIAQLNTGVQPVDVAMLRLMDSIKVSFILLPLASSTRRRDGNEEAPPPKPAKRAKGKGKGAEKGKGKDKGPKPAKPFPAELEGCWRSVKGKSPCHAFNLTVGCNLCSPGESCRNGVHLCCRPKCGEPHSASGCPKR